MQLLGQRSYGSKSDTAVTPLYCHLSRRAWEKSGQCDAVVGWSYAGLPSGGPSVHLLTGLKVDVADDDLSPTQVGRVRPGAVRVPVYAIIVLLCISVFAQINFANDCV